ncbi:LysR family transcriptional regulator [Temperatibacter marinus]|uniref:LysR family transcriptional regulator n=1 Tax=Temperatibacter marinus TaxID=1456591 RepID=A0AA52EEL3_9PROT|nr:LysR family transcriptional regulator [Temperatibacter marinus]WND03376.1 LysR family transcriptional regulator [Temperatibacter marinus]
MDDLTHILTFCRTVETGSVTEAAKSLNLTKSVASRRLSTLEENLGVSLLKRSPRGAVATEAGELYYDRARSILDRLDSARQEVSGLGSALVGRLRVTAPRSLGDILLNKAFSAFVKENAGIDLELNLTDKQVDLIGEGYDLGIRVGQLKDSSLIGKKLTDVRPAVVASPAYLKEHGTPETPEHLKDHECIFYSNVEARSQWKFQTSHGNTQSVRVKGRLITSSGKMQVQGALDGVGVAVLPMFFVHRSLLSGDLVELLSDYTQHTMGIYALYPPSRQQSTKVRALVDHMAAYFKSEGVKCCF